MTPVTAKPASMRLIAILLFVGMPALLLSLTVLNGVQFLSDRMTISDKENQLAALQRRLNTPRSGQKQTDLSSIYIAGASKALASANLQQHLVTAISTASGRLIETLSVEPADPSVETDDIRLKATLDIDNEGLLNLLYALEAGTPFLDVETLSVRRLQADKDATEAETLRVDMMVTAHWKRQSAP